MVFGGIDEARGHEDGYGDTEDIKEDVHAHFQGCHGVVKLIPLLVIKVCWNVLWVEPPCSALTSIVPKGDV